MGSAHGAAHADPAPGGVDPAPAAPAQHSVQAAQLQHGEGYHATGTVSLSHIKVTGSRSWGASPLRLAARLDYGGGLGDEDAVSEQVTERDGVLKWDELIVTVSLRKAQHRGLRVALELQEVISTKQSPPSTTASRALVISVSYAGALPGCNKDPDAFLNLLSKQGFYPRDWRVMKDVGSATEPTYPSRANVIAMLRWLAEGARRGDALYLLFCGKGPGAEGGGSVITAADGRGVGEADVLDHLVRPLPEGCRLTVICDRDEGGALITLPYQAQGSPDGSVSVAPGRNEAAAGGVRCALVQLSTAPRSSPASAPAAAPRGGALLDCVIGALGGSGGGRPTAEQLLAGVGAELRRRLGGSAPVPVLSSTAPIASADTVDPVAPAIALPFDTSRPPNYRPAKALVVGISYSTTAWALPGSLRDTRTYVDFMRRQGFRPTQWKVLTDDCPPNSEVYPNRENILAALRWLVEGAQPGDCLFLAYSGHGRQKADVDGDEIDGKDETIVPADFCDIIDDEIYATVVRPLPTGVRLTVFCDCCHSGTMMDLPFVLKADARGQLAGEQGRKDGRALGPGGEVVQVSACQDSEKAVDMGNNTGGALTHVIMEVLCRNPAPTLGELLRGLTVGLRNRLGEGCQVPVVSCNHAVSEGDTFYIVPGAAIEAVGVSTVASASLELSSGELSSGRQLWKRLPLLSRGPGGAAAAAAPAGTIEFVVSAAGAAAAARSILPEPAPAPHSAAAPPLAAADRPARVGRLVVQVHAASGLQIPCYAPQRVRCRVSVGTRRLAVQSSRAAAADRGGGAASWQGAALSFATDATRECVTLQLLADADDAPAAPAGAAELLRGSVIGEAVFAVATRGSGETGSGEGCVPLYPPQLPHCRGGAGWLQVSWLLVPRYVWGNDEGDDPPSAELPDFTELVSSAAVDAHATAPAPAHPAPAHPAPAHPAPAHPAPPPHITTPPPPPPPLQPVPAEAALAAPPQRCVPCVVRLRVLEVRGLKPAWGSRQPAQVQLRLCASGRRFRASVGEGITFRKDLQPDSAVAVTVHDAHPGSLEAFLGAAVVPLPFGPGGRHAPYQSTSWLPLQPRRDSVEDHERYFAPPQGLGEALVAVEVEPAEPQPAPARGSPAAAAAALCAARSTLHVVDAYRNQYRDQYSVYGRHRPCGLLGLPPPPPPFAATEPPPPPPPILHAGRCGPQLALHAGRTSPPRHQRHALPAF